MEMDLPEVCHSLINETTTFRNCSLRGEDRLTDLYNCSGEVSRQLCRSHIVCDTSLDLGDTSPDLVKFMTIILVIAFSLVGNVCTITILGKFKVHKVPDVLVMGLAVTDLVTTLIPIPMSAYAYIVGVNFTEGCILCDFFGTFALFSRFSSSQIVTIIAVERYLAVNRPFIYRKYATPRLFVFILLISWAFALLLGAVPLMVEEVATETHDGFCIFDLDSWYSIVFFIYACVQYVTVFVCFVLVIKELVKVYRRRSRLKVQGEYNRSSRARHRDSHQQHEVTFTRPNLTSRCV